MSSNSILAKFGARNSKHLCILSRNDAKNWVLRKALAGPESGISPRSPGMTPRLMFHRGVPSQRADLQEAALATVEFKNTPPQPDHPGVRSPLPPTAVPRAPKQSRPPVSQSSQHKTGARGSHGCSLHITTTCGHLGSQRLQHTTTKARGQYLPPSKSRVSVSNWQNPIST